ncbi:tRNA 5'-guanylyltransferase [bacterium]|nr:tRNA 5'-guanylyltransferase [bacterium]
MNPSHFEDRMRALEYFHSIVIPPEMWVVVRVDGRSFSKFTESRFAKPFDESFRDLMVETAQALLEEMGGLYAYTESDEISVLFPLEWDFFGRELEKVVSISASIAAARFTLSCGEVAHFDSRVWIGPNSGTVVDYFRWRQSDATRCCLNGWTYWTLREEGKTAKEATSLLESLGKDEKNELLFERGTNFNDLPLWQRRGTGLYFETYAMEGFNPQTEQAVWAERRRVKIDQELPMKDEYSRFISRFMEELAG